MKRNHLKINLLKKLKMKKKPNKKKKKRSIKKLRKFLKIIHSRKKLFPKKSQHQSLETKKNKLNKFLKTTL